MAVFLPQNWQNRQVAAFAPCWYAQGPRRKARRLEANAETVLNAWRRWCRSAGHASLVNILDERRF
jgi:hypothetical protein